jgi:hypothetical protein
MNVARFSVLVFMVSSVLGCGPAVGETRTVIRPAKSEDCKLELVSVTSAQMQSGAGFGSGGTYEMIGVISIGAEEGTDPMSEEIRRLVRPRACSMGGDVVTLLASGTGANRRGFAQQNIVYTVWATRPEDAATPKPF